MVNSTITILAIKALTGNRVGPTMSKEMKV